VGLFRDSFYFILSCFKGTHYCDMAHPYLAEAENGIPLAANILQKTVCI
jgi:hypothetical protein